MKLIYLLIFVSLFIFLPGQILAADLNINCLGGVACSKSGIDPLFSVTDGYWYPGRVLTKTLNLNNSSSGVRDMAVKGVRVGSSSILENAMMVSITTSGGSLIWSGSVSNFYLQERILLGRFNSGANQDYNLTVSMNNAADNSTQTLTLLFDFSAGFWGDIITPTPTPTPAEGEGEGEGDSGGGGVSLPVCDDPAPGGAPGNLTAIVTGPNQVRLDWTEGPGPLTYYLIAFGRASGVMEYGNPNIGGSGTTSYIVKGLSGGTTYFFKVRAGNNCMPGDFSNEISATPYGELTVIPPLGFQEGVLGISAEELDIEDEEEGILGISEPEDGGSFMKNNLQKITTSFLIGILILFLYQYIRGRKKT